MRYDEFTAEEAAELSGCILARWDEKQGMYIAPALQIWSENGDDWHDDFGGQPDDEEFHAATILLSGGPRDGVKVK